MGDRIIVTFPLGVQVPSTSTDITPDDVVLKAGSTTYKLVQDNIGTSNINRTVTLTLPVDLDDAPSPAIEGDVEVTITFTKAAGIDNPITTGSAGNPEAIEAVEADDEADPRIEEVVAAPPSAGGVDTVFAVRVPAAVADTPGYRDTALEFFANQVGDVQFTPTSSSVNAITDWEVTFDRPLLGSHCSTALTRSP